MLVYLSPQGQVPCIILTPFCVPLGKPLVNIKQNSASSYVSIVIFFMKMTT